MIIKTLDGIEIHCLPDNAVCYASDGCVSPEKLTACPIGGEECCPEGCPYYDEVDIETIETPPWEHTFCNRVITRGRVGENGTCRILGREKGEEHMKINICGIEHEIVEYEDNFNVETHMGQSDFGTCKIKINKNMPCQLKAATLCHEILHGMLVHIGREDLSNDEQLVTALGNAINGSFKIKEVE
jgi:hypothetical protein